MKKSNHLFLYRPVTLGMVSEMFTGWFDQTLLRQFIRGAWGFGFMIFVVFPMGMKWLKGESHDCD